MAKQQWNKLQQAMVFDLSRICHGCVLAEGVYSLDRQLCWVFFLATVAISFKV